MGQRRATTPTRSRVATEFEIKVKQLGLTKQTCAASKELRSWCESNRNRCYIPEWLLNEWGIPRGPDLELGIH